MIFLFAFIGGIGVDLLRWAESKPAEPFDLRKFLSSVLRSLFSALVVAFSGAVPDGAYLAAVIAGAGGDVIAGSAYSSAGNIIDKIKNKTKTTP